MLNIYKPAGFTPLQALDALRARYPEYRDETLSYAGRLDPLAEGVMLVLVGAEENKNRDRYLSLDKEYEVAVLFGFATDTGDALGIVTAAGEGSVEAGILEAALQGFVGRRKQVAPRFSSPGIDGKAFEREIEVYQTELLGIATVPGEELKSEIRRKIDSVQGDFRQEAIKERWSEETFSGRELSVARLRIRCSSGTYMRVLAEDLGREIGLAALAFRIVRTKAGNFGIEEALVISGAV